MTDEPKTIDLPPGTLLHARLRRRMVTLLRTPSAWWDIRPQPPREALDIGGLRNVGLGDDPPVSHGALPRCDLLTV